MQGKLMSASNHPISLHACTYLSEAGKWQLEQILPWYSGKFASDSDGPWDPCLALDFCYSSFQKVVEIDKVHLWNWTVSVVLFSTSLILTGVVVTVTVWYMLLKRNTTNCMLKDMIKISECQS